METLIDIQAEQDSSWDASWGYQGTRQTEQKLIRSQCAREAFKRKVTKKLSGSQAVGSKGQKMAGRKERGRTIQEVRIVLCDER